jgi:hypothetical protein
MEEKTAHSPEEFQLLPQGVMVSGTTFSLGFINEMKYM